MRVDGTSERDCPVSTEDLVGLCQAGYKEFGACPERMPMIGIIEEE